MKSTDASSPARGGPAARRAGPHSLARRFWLGFALPWLVSMLALGAAATWVQVEGASLHVTSIALLLGWPLAIALVLWGAVGVWRATRARVAVPARRHRAWGWAALAAVAAGVLAMAAELVLGFGAQAGSYAALARGEDPLGRVTATPSADGQRLRLTGRLGMNDAALVLGQIDALPRLRLLELDLAGGRTFESRRLGQAVAARGLKTRVVGACNNACVLVYMAGKGREVMQQGRLGFHRLATASINPLFVALARREQAALYLSQGLPDIFVTKLLATPSGRLWQPDIDELLSAGLVGVPGRPLDIDLPGPAGTPAVEYLESLQSHWLWRALDARHADVSLAAASRMAAARDQGAADDATQVAGQRVLEALMPRLLSDAGPGLWEPYAALLSDQLLAAALLGPMACQGVLAGDAQTRRSLPAPLPQREAAWLASALSSPAPEGPPRRSTPLEREVMRRALGERAVELLAGFLGPGRRDGNCARATALLAEVAALPPGERHLAMRFMFGPR